MHRFAVTVVQHILGESGGDMTESRSDLNVLIGGGFTNCIQIIIRVNTF